MYNVLVDFHHAGLLNSLIMLFEGRLGGNVARPIGREWYEQGFWKVHEHPATVAQYLDIGGATPDNTPRLNDVKEKVDWGGRILPDGGVENDGTSYFCHDIDSGKTNRAITLDTFMNSHCDFIIASIPQHIAPFRRLCDMHRTHPKLIYQIGNDWNVGENKGMIDAVLSSARVYIPHEIPHVVYHQEFPLDIFNPSNIPDGPVAPQITSFVNCFDVDEMFKHDYLQFERIERQLSPHFEFRIYGGQCRDGAAHGMHDVAARMGRSQFIWHVKRGGDGYGHILHNAAAMGKPLIVKMGYYIAKLGGDLLIPDQTCIAIDGLSDEQIVNKIKYYSDPVRYSEMSNALYSKFLEEVNFERESEAIANLLKSLL